MFDRVLLATDGSDPAYRAAKYGLELGVRYEAAVEIVSVHRREAGRSAARAAVDATADLAADLDVTPQTETLSGRPATAIVDRAAERDADLIVVGRQGRSGVRAHLLGSVTERVLRRTSVPVLTVPDGDVDADTGADYDDLLVTTDGSETAARAAPYAADLARRFETRLHALNAVDVRREAGVFDAGGVDGVYVERLESRGLDAVEHLVGGIDTSALDVRRAVVRGSVHEAIDEYVTTHGVDLIVLSSTGQSNLARQRLGTVAGRILRTADLPVLVVAPA